jgi:hypothetical protein
MRNDSRGHHFIGLTVRCSFSGEHYHEQCRPGTRSGGRREDLFEDNCMVCHGRWQCEGIMVGLLTSQPSDLAQLASRNGGHFPFGRSIA